MLELTDRRLHLQNYYAREWAENFMVYIGLEDARAWHEHVSAKLEGRAFLEPRVQPPKQEPYGALVTCACDLSGGFPISLNEIGASHGGLEHATNESERDRY